MSIVSTLVASIGNWQLAYANVGRSIVVALCALLMLALASAARAEYPDRPIKMIVPYQAGGATDFVARMVAQNISIQLKQPVIVENRPGAGGTIGESLVARSAPDGYTVLIDATGVVMNPSLYQKSAYDPTDLQPVAQLMTSPFVIVTNPNAPIRSLSDIATFARQNASKFNVATAGNSTLLAAHMFRLQSGAHFGLIP